MTTIQDAAVFEDLGLSRGLQGANRSTELGQEDFLTLMTTQLRNQDPFKPMENGDFLGQLAQFGAVTGIKDLQTAFKDLSNSLYSSQTLQAASMVGREVLVPGEYAQITGEGGMSGAVDLPVPVSSLNVGIYDLSGQLIRNIELGPQSAGMPAFSWDGLNAQGEAVVPGRYEIRAEALNGNTNEIFDVLVTDRVESVSLPSAGGAFTLELAGVGEKSFSDIRQIR